MTWEAADSNDLGEGGDCLAGVASAAPRAPGSTRSDPTPTRAPVDPDPSSRRGGVGVGSGVRRGGDRGATFGGVSSGVDQRGAHVARRRRREKRAATIPGDSTATKRCADQPRGGCTSRERRRRPSRDTSTAPCWRGTCRAGNSQTYGGIRERRTLTQTEGDAREEERRVVTTPGRRDLVTNTHSETTSRRGHAPKRVLKLGNGTRDHLSPLLGTGTRRRASRRRAFRRAIPQP